MKQRDCKKKEARERELDVAGAQVRERKSERERERKGERAQGGVRRRKRGAVGARARERAPLSYPALRAYAYLWGGEGKNDRPSKRERERNTYPTLLSRTHTHSREKSHVAP